MHLGDGTTKIFLNMSSKKGSKDLVSLLQYMKETTLENPNILVKDKRILELDHIVAEVKESEEWEAMQMNILEIGIEKGIEQGIEQGVQGMIAVCREFGYTKEETLQQVQEKCEIPSQKAQELLEKYWK